MASASTVFTLGVGCLLGLASVSWPQPTTRVSVDSSGAEGARNDASFEAAISSDGSVVAFQCDAQLVAGDTGGHRDIYVHERLTRTTTRVSVDSAGVQANGQSVSPALSEDGRFVVFASVATNLVAGDTNSRQDIFVRDRLNGTTRRVSISSSGTQGNGSCTDPAISADGRFVGFASAATNLDGLDGNGQPDVFVHDLLAGTTKLVSRGMTGAPAGGGSAAPALSFDGRFTAFVSTADDIVPGDTGFRGDIFVHDRDTGLFTRVSVDSAGLQGDGHSSGPSISWDGQCVVFHSISSNLDPVDTNGATDVFLHDRGTASTSLVSRSSSGAAGNGHSSTGSVSADGRWVAFQSAATNFDPSDTNTFRDIYLRDRLTSTTTRLSVDLFGAGGKLGGERAGISANGRLVSFDSLGDDLVASDGNDAHDVFVRDRIALSFNGTPQSGQSVNFSVSTAFGEETFLAMTLLSASGTAGFSLPNDGRVVPLTWDAVTSFGLLFPFLLSATIDATGAATMPTFPFPSAPVGLTISSAAVTIDLSRGVFGSVTGPTAFVTQ